MVVRSVLGWTQCPRQGPAGEGLELACILLNGNLPMGGQHVFASCALMKMTAFMSSTSMLPGQQKQHKKSWRVGANRWGRKVCLFLKPRRPALAGQDISQSHDPGDLIQYPKTGGKRVGPECLHRRPCEARRRNKNLECLSI